MTKRPSLHLAHIAGLIWLSMAGSALGQEGIIKDCDHCPVLVFVPAGHFTMGSPATEERRDEDEGPQHEVTISSGFAVGKFEVTFAEWDACVANGGCRRDVDDNGWGRGQQPVINVTWNDAVSYVEWLSKTTGKSYRLLSESEWEYVGRGGTTTVFSTGPTITTDQANFNGNHVYGGSQKGIHRKKTLPVGSFAANNFGLHDTHGNVIEWVQDCWHDNYNGAPADGSPWMTGTCAEHALRGGEWNAAPGAIRSANRDSWGTGMTNHFIGFRVARSL